MPVRSFRLVTMEFLVVALWAARALECHYTQVQRATWAVVCAFAGRCYHDSQRDAEFLSIVSAVRPSSSPRMPCRA